MLHCMFRSTVSAEKRTVLLLIFVYYYFIMAVFVQAHQDIASLVKLLFSYAFSF